VKKLLLVTAALAAAVAVLVSVSLPPKRLAVPPQPDGTVPGILHVHTKGSDGIGGPDEIAAAAARAGLKFVVFTDHGDATRQPDPPAYRSGVLCLDGVEISTTGGHYIAIDMPQAPYPLGGEPRDVAEDVRRLGGFGIAAHPDSPKAQLRWNDWSVPVDAIEIVNLDTSWRQWAHQANAPADPASGGSPRWPARRRLLAALTAYPFRPAETIGSLVQTGGLVPRWAGLAAGGRVVMLAGADAHARLGLRSDPADSTWALPFPAYESSFKTMSVHVALEEPLTGTADADAARLMRAIRAGHVYTALDSIATPPSLDVVATNARGTARPGDQLTPAGPVTLRVRSNAPAAFTTVVWNGANRVGADHREQNFTVALEDTGVYWVEVRSSDRAPEVAWLTSNPVYVRNVSSAASDARRSPAATTQALFDGGSGAGWRVEHDPTSLAAVDVAPIVGGAELRFRFGLSGGSLVGQVAALVAETPNGVASADRATFTIRAEQPMRVSVQLRTGGGASQRWARSVYVDATEQEHTIFFDDMRPVGQTTALTPPRAEVRNMLFVVDTINTRPGASGRIWIKRAALAK
jgi:hypothetical protein